MIRIRFHYSTAQARSAGVQIDFNVHPIHSDFCFTGWLLSAQHLSDPGSAELQYRTSVA